jgi:hypothetical protein
MTTNYFPPLTDLLDPRAIPGDLEFIENNVQAVLDKIFYKDLVVDMSSAGDEAGYSLVLLTKGIRLPLFGTGMELVFFRGADADFAEFPIDFSWKWGIRKYIAGFETEGFSYALEAFIEIFFALAGIQDFEEFFGAILNVFLDNGTDDYLAFFNELISTITVYNNGSEDVATEIQNIVDQLEEIKDEVSALLNNSNLFHLNQIYQDYQDNPKIQPAVESIQTSLETLQAAFDIDVDVYTDVVKAVIKDIGDIDEKFEKLVELFKTWLADITLEEVENLLIPQFAVELKELSMALEFPREFLLPMKQTGGVWQVDPNGKAAIVFTAGSIAYSTETGFEIDISESHQINLPRCMIPNLGLQLEFLGVKLDLSRTYNIAEATADDRPEDFIGAYIREANIFLPEKWFKFDEDGSTLKIFAKNLIVGTGGLSGTIGLAAVAGLDPVLQENMLLRDGVTIISIAPGPDNIPNEGDDVFFGTAPAEDDRYVLKDGGTLIVEDNKLKRFLSSDGELSYKLGKDSGEGQWEIGFVDFYLKFWQNKIQESEIKGFLTVPNFKQCGKTGALRIDVSVFFENDGDFKITAAPQGGLVICLGEDGKVFKIKVNSLEAGKDHEKLYLETSGHLDFSNNPLLNKFLQNPIEVKKLRIYSDGSFEIEGGSIPIPSSVPLNLGPVEVNITNITLGSEKLNQGDYKFIGFDCGVSTGSGGLDLRGDGIKIYFNHDGSDMFLRIAGIGINLIIPGSADEDTAALILKGYLSMKEAEYTGAVSFKLPKAEITGGAAMKMQPKIPAFVVDAFVELSTPLPLGPTGLGIFEFRGLFGLRYIADLLPGATSNPDKMFEFYTAKKPNPLTNTDEKGLHLGKIIRPEDAPEDDEGFKKSGTPISIGAGLSLGTTSDAGRAFSLQAFLFLSLPEFFMISGKGNVLGERVKIISEKEPPFFGYMAITREYISIGLGAEYKVRENEGQFLELNAEAQLAFFFNDASAWYVHFGTKAEPIQAKVLKKIFNLNAYAYLMLSAAGIETGAGIKFEMHKKYGPVKIDVSAYGDVYAMISFRKPQVGGGIACGGRISASAFGVGFDITLDAYLMVTAPRPFIVKGGASVCVEVNLRIKKWRKCVDLEFKWEFAPHDSDKSEIKILDTVPFPVSGFHIGSQNTYKLTYFGATFPLPGSTVETIPLDTFIDIQLKKPVDPTTIRLVTGEDINPIGGVSNPASNNIEYVPPKDVEGRVTHRFEIATINIKVLNGANWQDYNPYQALDPGAFLQNVDISKLKIGTWQKKGKEYNNLRLLATSPFSYADNMTGGFLPEQMGLTAASLFCEGKEIDRHCIGWNEGETYGIGRWHSYQNMTFNVTKFDAEVVTFTNVFDIPRSLRIDNRSKLEIILPQKCLETNFKLYSYARKLSVSFYDLQDIPVIQNGVERNQAEYVLINQRVLSLIDYMAPVTYNSDTQTIKKIVIEAATPSIETVHGLTNELHELVQFKLEANNQVSEEVELRIDEIRENLEALEAETCNSNTQEEDLADITGLIETLQAQIVDLRIEIEQIEQEISENCEPVPIGEICEELNRQLEEKLEELRNTEERLDRLERLYDIVLNEEPEQIDRCSTYLHEVCYLTQTERWYNQSIPSQEMIDADYDAFSDAVRKVIAPIWRPDETYAVEIITRETINSGPTDRPYYFAFKTAGPIGHFPLKFLPDDLKRQYGLDGEGMPANTDTSFSKDVEIPENALKFYIDYDKSYPNPIGNIINQKPLFYNNPNLLIFYIEPYVYHFFSNWPNYDSLGEKLASMRIEVKDPSEQLQPVDGVPPVLTVMPNPILNWKIDQTPPVKQSIAVMNNLRNPVDFNGTTCWETGDDPIVPASKNTEIEVENLKPSKLYNVNVFSRYSKNGSRHQEKQIHSYPFQTSRYADLNAQVNSYQLKDLDFNTGQLLSSRDAIYKLSYNFDNLGITLVQLQDIVLGNDVANGFKPNLIQNYPEALQRLLLGYLQQAPLPPALNTELNMLSDADDRLFGIWVRNPEPFNDPRIPPADLRNSVGLLIDEEQVMPINPLFSKDRSEILILHEDLSKPAEMVNLIFAYLVWNGTVYIQDQSVTTKNLI